MTDEATTLTGETLERRRGPLWYAQEAVRIARIDTEAMGRVARDRVALFYGTAVMIVVIAVGVAAVWLAPGPQPGGTRAVTTLTMRDAAVIFGVQLLGSAINTALIHGAAKLIFGATGTYLGVLRVLWLGSSVQVLTVIPIVGWIAAGVWSLLITLVTFEEVDGIERLQALALSIGLAAISAVIGSLLR